MSFESDSFKKGGVKNPARQMREFTVENKNFDDFEQVAPTKFDLEMQARAAAQQQNPYLPKTQDMPATEPGFVGSKVDQAHALRAKFAQQSQPDGGFVKQRIEFLANLGRQYRDVKIADAVITLRSLKSKEHKELLQLALKEGGSDFEFSLRFQLYQLAQSLYKINGEELYFVLGGDDTFDNRVKLLDVMQQETFDYLVAQFEQMKKDIVNSFQVKTETDSKELIEQLKK